MRDIVISIQNDLIAEAVIWGLEESGEFQTFKLLFSKENEVLHECARIQPEMLLCEVAFGKHTNFEARLKESSEVKKSTRTAKSYSCATKIPPRRSPKR